jgi:hypothetical protein
MSAFGTEEIPLFPSNAASSTFTRLDAQIMEEDGTFTVSIRMHNHLNQAQNAWGQKIATNFYIAQGMVEDVAKEFDIPEKCISIKIVMSNYKDGTVH